MRVTFRRGRKIGDPNYGSTEFGIELQMDVEDDVFNDDVIFSKFCATNFSFADQLLEAERERIYASRPKRPAPAPVPAEPTDGDRAIEEARSRREPAAARNGHEKPRYNWQQSRNPEPDRRPAPEERRGGGGKSYGPPKSGSQLFAWAKGREEAGADGFVKALGAWCKDHNLPWRFNDLSPADVREVYEAGQEMLNGSGGY